MSSGSVTIIGAGISGLTVAFWLRQWGHEVTVLEKEASSGGTMRSMREGEWLIERGPTSALETTPLLGRMIEALGLLQEREYANPSSDRRYILRGGELHALPLSPLAFLRSGLWSARGKLRLLKEPFLGRAEHEETIAQFVERRLGREFLDYAINPFVAGVYAGNPEELSVRAAFPKLYALEERYGGLIRGMVLGARERAHREEKAKDRARMFSFRDGMQTFPDAIARLLGRRLKGSREVSAISRSRGGTYRVIVGAGAEVLESPVVVLSTPAGAASSLIGSLDPPLARRLGQVYSPPVAEVFFGFRASQVGRALDGFGYLVPAKEQRKILGTIWSSAIFSHRAPEGHVALTTFVGGSRQGELLQEDDRTLRALVLDDLCSIMGVHGEPVLERIVRWKAAIPQYHLGHLELDRQIEAFEANHPGFYFCSNYHGGIAVGDCVISGEKTARRIHDSFPATGKHLP
jgi:oxygen-dependent protoporphyrinogen oxidase